MAVGRSSSGGGVIRYVLPVLWMMSKEVIYSMHRIYNLLDDVIYLLISQCLGLPLTSIYLLEYSSEYLNEYSSTR